MTILTDVGQRRTNNQDYANQYKNKAGKSMVLLADGMGGHRAGNIASEMAVTDLGAAWVSSEIETVNQVTGMVCRTFRSCEPSDSFGWAR